MTNVGIPFELINTQNETNTYNEFQGNFRTSILDLDLLHYALEKNRKGSYFFETQEHLVITCMDQLTEYQYTVKGQIIKCKNEYTFIKGIANILGIESVYLSHSPNSNLTREAMISHSVFSIIFKTFAG